MGVICEMPSYTMCQQTAPQADVQGSFKLTWTMSRAALGDSVAVGQDGSLSVSSKQKIPQLLRPYGLPVQAGFLAARPISKDRGRAPWIMATALCDQATIINLRQPHSPGTTRKFISTYSSISEVMTCRYNAVTVQFSADPDT